MSTQERIARVRISLEEIQPVIWRRVEVPVASSLKGLHDVIQAAFGWQSYHFFEFEIDGRRYGIPDPDIDRKGEVVWARNTKLAAVIAKEQMRFAYTYDFGNGWSHAVEIEAVLDGEPDVAYPRLVEGGRRCPPEDVGGPRGYCNFIDAMADASHERHADLLEWHGGPYDPEDMDRSRCAVLVGWLAARRAGKAALAKRRKAGNPPDD